MRRSLDLESGRWGLAATCLLLVAFVAGLAWADAGPAPTMDGIGKPPTQIGKGLGNRTRGEIPSTAGVMSGPTMRGNAVYPAQQLPLKFNHKLHLAKGIDCLRCHTKIDQSRRSSDDNFPRGVACDECHGAQHPKPATEPAKCSMCHTRIDDKNRLLASLRAPRPMLHFNHKMHIDRGSTCKDCHGDMSKVRLATTLQLPQEADCLTCHDGVTATGRCGACHPTEASGRLQTRAMDDRALPALVPQGDSGWGMAHDLTFVEDHTGAARANPKLCESCHDDTFCTDCHAGSIRPMRIHSGDYLTTHALDSRAQTQNCQACHRVQTFCLGCHDRVGFGDRDQGQFGVGGGLTFHPDGWSGPPGTRQSHAQAAQVNMAACASCHDEDSCLACHATTSGSTPGLGVSPHGPSFAQSSKCHALSIHNRRVCLKCHPPGDPQLECM